MLKALIRLLGFFSKEVNEVRRQPRLVLSLMLGPFLILLLFGAGYQGGRPILRTELIVPPNSIDQAQLQSLQRAIGTNFKLVAIHSDQNAALQRLQAGTIDVVEILPADIQARVLKGEQAPIEIKYNEINPFNEQWIQYLGYAQVSEINRSVLLQTTQQMQGQAGSAEQRLKDIRTQLDALNSGLSSTRQQEIQKSLRDFKAATSGLEDNPVFAAELATQGQSPDDARKQMTELRKNLDDIDQAISQGRLDQQKERIASTRNQVDQVEKTTHLLASLPPEVIVSPLQQQYQNLRGKSDDFMTYYAPSVLALILQHIAITLGALSLVRERLLGAVELFKVAPVSAMQVLLGKYFGYTLFIGIIAGVLMAALIYLLKIPFLGSVPMFVGLLILLTVASLGIGFTISVLSTSESQAVQLSMLVLLMSIFFSGFFLPLENFTPQVQLVGDVLPLTHGIAGFQNTILRGLPPANFNLLALAIISLVTYTFVALVMRSQFRRA